MDKIEKIYHKVGVFWDTLQNLKNMKHFIRNRIFSIHDVRVNHHSGLSVGPPGLGRAGGDYQLTVQCS